MVSIVEGTNTGTSGNDTFELISSISSFSLDGGAGTDTLTANIGFLGSWSYSNVERLILTGSRDSRYSFRSDSETVDLSGTTSELVVTGLVAGMTITGGANTYVQVKTDLPSTATVNFDMQSGAIGGNVLSDQLGGSTVGTYTGMKGFLSFGSMDTVQGTSGNDRVSLGGGTNSFDGRDGLDKIGVVGARNDFTVTKTSTGLTVVRSSDPSSETTTTTNVERVEYFDSAFNTIGQLAFDTDGAAGQTYRLYKAAFNRTPDDAGLSHNVNLMDGGMSILDMASAFIGSQEFQNTYGSNVDNTAFLTLLYQNVLNRGPDDAGLAGWLSQLNSGTSREQVLFGFSESGENKANVASAIDDGIWLS